MVTNIDENSPAAEEAAPAIDSASLPPSGLEPILISPDDAFRMLGIKRTKGYELLRDGHLTARKIGTRTGVETASIRRFAAKLPRAGARRS